jgi:hypothetical protein
METYVCPVNKDPTKRGQPQQVSSVFMQGNWTWHAYAMSHDGKTNITYREDGFDLHRGTTGRAIKLDMELPYNPRDFYWHPDCRRVAFWVSAPPLDPSQFPGWDANARTPSGRPPGIRSLALLDTSRVTGDVKATDKPPYEIIYQMSMTSSPFGLEWSPKGDAVFVIEHTVDPSNQSNLGTITRIDLADTKHPHTIITMPGTIDFFMPPTSRFERGQGPVQANYKLIFGHLRGLYVCDPDGQNVRRLSQLPAVGLFNVEWNPDPRKSEVLLFFKREVTSEDGRSFHGVYRVTIPTGNGPEAEAAKVEQLYDGTDIHTLWYSPTGKYMTWASPGGLWFRRPDDPPEKTTQLDAPTVDGVPLEIKGAAWSDDERHVAFVATNHLFIYDVPPAGSTGTPEPPYDVAMFGTPDTHFGAEPRWVGDQVYLSVFEDALKTKRVDHDIHFNRQGQTQPGKGQTPSGQGQPQPQQGSQQHPR